MKFMILSVFAAFLINACATTTKNQSQLQLANEYAKDGLFREAIETYKQALIENPKSPLIHRNLGMVLLKVGDYKSSREHLELAINRYEHNFDTNFYLAEALRSLEMYADAIFRYQKALKLKEREPRALKALAWSYFKIRYYSEAASTVAKLESLTPNDEQTVIIKARVLLKLKKGELALNTIEKYKSQIKPSSQPFFNSVLGDIYYELGKKKEASEAYIKSLREEPLLASALYGYGQILADSGDTKNAIKQLERALRVKPKQADAHLQLAKIFQKSDRQRAISHYTAFISLAEADPEYLGELKTAQSELSQLKTLNKTSEVARSSDSKKDVKAN